MAETSEHQVTKADGTVVIQHYDDGYLVGETVVKKAPRKPAQPSPATTEEGS